MRRALILIILITAFCVGLGLYADTQQTRTARGYMEELEAIRRNVLAGRTAQAAADVRHMHALWQHDSEWLKCLIVHQYIRAVDTALLNLGTALEQGWAEDALRAADESFLALKDIEESHRAVWVNII